MLLIGNGRLITRDPENPYLENGAVLIDGSGLISAVGETAFLRSRNPDADFLDAEGKVIMPGLINAHNHIYSAFARGLSVRGYNPKGFLDVLDGMWWTLDRHLTLRDTRLSADAFLTECIENGVTTVMDHHAGYGAIRGSLFAIAESARALGVRVNLCYEISDRDGRDKMEEALRENVEFADYVLSRPRDDTLGAMMGMHAQFTLSDSTLEKCMAARRPEIGVHIHVAEGIEDVTACLKEHGKRPVFRLHDFGILSPKTVCAHCTHISEAEMDLLKETGTAVVHNPESNMGNAIGCPPALRMMEKGIPVCLGTDGYTNDMLESYKVGNLLHKHNLCSPAVAWNELPRMLFENNPLLCSRWMERPVGILKPGAHGDVIILDYTPPTPMDASNLNSHILFGMSGRSVTDTVVGGKILMRRRELMNVDKQKLLSDCRQNAAALWSRINA